MALLAISLVACGGGDTIPADEAPAPTIAVAEPTAEPTDEPPAAPTAEPTVIEPTAEPPAAPPTAEPTAPPAEVALAPGECGNAFYPVVDGRVMTYATNSTLPGAEEYSITYSNVTDSSFTLSTDVGDGNVFSTDWQCSADGLLSPTFSQLPDAMTQLSIEFVEATGVTVPAEDMFQVGQSWPTHYVANATMAVDDSTSMAMVQTMDMTNTVTGVEAVSVPAGDYPEAFVVETVGAISSEINMGDTTMPGIALELTYTSWYVEGIGVVRQEFADFFGEAGDGAYVTELVSVE